MQAMFSGQACCCPCGPNCGFGFNPAPATQQAPLAMRLGAPLQARRPLDLLVDALRLSALQARETPEPDRDLEHPTRGSKHVSVRRTGTRSASTNSWTCCSRRLWTALGLNVCASLRQVAAGPLAIHHTATPWNKLSIASAAPTVPLRPRCRRRETRCRRRWPEPTRSAHRPRHRSRRRRWRPRST